MQTAAQVPEVDLVAVIVINDVLQDRAVLEHVRRAPLAGDYHIQTDGPPEMVYAHDPVRRIAFGRPDAIEADVVGAAVDCMKTVVAGAGEDGIGLYRFDQFGVVGSGLASRM